MERWSRMVQVGMPLRLRTPWGWNMADWWATAEGYLSHVSKAQIAQALKEAGADLAGIGDMKKDALAVS